MVCGFYVVYENYFFIADIPDSWCYVRDASYEVGVYFVWCGVCIDDA